VAGKLSPVVAAWFHVFGADIPYSIPVTLTFEQATGKNVLLLPMGSSTDGAHSINEKLDKRNYIEGIKLLGSYLHYVAVEPTE
jgi:Cys-Gly metallodipeptidase DUG1